MSRATNLLQSLPVRGLLLIAALCLLPAAFPLQVEGAELPVARNAPHAGFVYPAGGQVGTSFQISVGGQNLRNVQGVYLSGEGVKTSVVLWIPPFRPGLLDGNQRRLLQRTLRELINRKRGASTGGGRNAGRNRPGAAGKEGDEVKLPEHPYLNDLQSKTVTELQEIAAYFFRRVNPLQRKRSIEEIVKINVTIDADAEPGMRDLRLRTKVGLSPPVRFRVGLQREVREVEPNYPEVPKDSTVDLPVVFNGQILPQDVDRFRFRAKEGQRLVMRTEARALVPYQADSVPGWMQASLSVFDSEGREVAYADEYRFDPDPVLFFVVPEDGEYVLEVRDAVSRGRDDFVYRVIVGELPFITSVYPLGGQTGRLVSAEVEGWNIRWRRVPLDTRDPAAGMRETAWRQGDGITNEVAYDVDVWPEENEVEPNDDPAEIEPLKIPMIFNGRIDEPGDVDVFPFKGSGGAEVVVDVCARDLGSPLDSVIRLTDAKGKVVAWNDDYKHECMGVRGLGLLTHHADSYLRARLPKSGTFYVRVTDVRRHGGKDHAYRLRIGPPRPGVLLFTTPSAVSAPAGRATLIKVHAIRTDGYEGEVHIELKDAPEGWSISGGRIPKGRDGMVMTLTAPPNPTEAPISLDLIGKIKSRSKEIEVPVVPADNVMQAFLWRHLVPARELAVVVQGAARGIPTVALKKNKPIKIPRGGKVKTQVTMSRAVLLRSVSLSLFDPPKGVTIGSVVPKGGGFTVEIKASRDTEEVGYEGNLIIQATLNAAMRNSGKGATPEQRRRNRARRNIVLGYLPAIPYVITRR